MIFIPIKLVLGKHEIGMLAGEGLALDSPVEAISLVTKAHQGMEGRTWLPNAKSDAITTSYVNQ